MATLQRRHPEVAGSVAPEPIELIWLDAMVTYGILQGEPKNREYVRGRLVGLMAGLSLMAGLTAAEVRIEVERRYREVSAR